MLSLDPNDLKTNVLHQYLLYSVAPRPIAFASTVDKDGKVNLSPFSFFNVFSARPPIAVFSPSRSGRTGQTKNTYDNVKEVPEVVINIVNYPIVHQMSLTSAEYPKGVNEFVKAGLTEIPSVKVRPPRVKESPVQLECKVLEVKELGQNGGAGNLVICEVVMLHIHEEILNPETQMIDQQKIDLVARMGGDLYCRASGSAIFTIKKPLTTIGMGVDQIPAHIRTSKVLTGNHLGLLGNCEHMPSAEEVQHYKTSGAILEVFQDYGKDHEKLDTHLHHIAARLLDDGKVEEAWKVLLSD
ncbi:MAG TPA: flavin reductase family protein [Bacteroidia bacterium]|jgi:flavin reductase (DIM6/NTAB) family NADH-FMN oxidoreductase RutF|nr:flavin reductase family protein [Bacteroidia bacterium]